MSTRLDNPATMPKMRPTPRSPNSKKAAKRRRLQKSQERRAIRAAMQRPTMEEVQRARLGL